MAADLKPDAASPRQNGKPATEEDPSTNGPTAAAAFRVISDRLTELKTYAGYYLSAKLDRLKLTVRQTFLMVMLGLVAAVAAASAAVTAIVLILQGIAGGLGALCGHNPWLGDLLCGVLVLGIVVFGIWYFIRSFTQTNRQATVNKYESEQTRQRADLGLDVEQRATTQKTPDASRLSEAEFLEQQARTAMAAMQAAVQEIKVELAQGLSPIELAKRHPWLALLGSAAGGFAAAATLVPSKEQQALNHLRRVHEAMHPQPQTPPTHNGKEPHEKTHPIGGMLIAQLLGLIRPIVVSLLSAAMSSHTKQPSDQPAHSTADPSAPPDVSDLPPR